MTTKNTQDKNEQSSAVDSTSTGNVSSSNTNKKGGTDAKRDDPTSKSSNPTGDKNSDKQKVADKPNAQGTKKGL